MESNSGMLCKMWHPNVHILLTTPMITIEEDKIYFA